MKKLLLVATVVGAIFLVSGCAFAPMPVMGGIYGDVEFNGNYNQGHAGAVTQTIKGDACASSILGIIATGDASIHTAIEKAGGNGKKLMNVRVDHHGFNILSFYAKYCTVVTADVVN